MRLRIGRNLRGLIRGAQQRGEGASDGRAVDLTLEARVFDDEVDNLERQGERVVMAAVLVEVCVTMAEVVEGSGVEQDAGAVGKDRLQASSPGVCAAFSAQIEVRPRFLPWLLS